MSYFLYFKAGGGKVTRADVEQYGLDYALGESIETREVLAGPDGSAGGWVFCDSYRAGNRAAAYQPDQQTWRELPHREGRPALWVGYWNDAKPTPASLQRPAMLPGAGVLLADGHQWTVPIVRRAIESDSQLVAYECQLPCYLDYDAEGRVTKGRVLGVHQRLWDLTAPVADAKFGTGDPLESEQQLYTAVVALLRANYVVDLPELVLLGVLADDESLALVVQVSCRYDQLRQWVAAARDDNQEGDQKKTESTPPPGGSTTSAGDAG